MPSLPLDLIDYSFIVFVQNYKYFFIYFKELEKK